MVAGNIWYLYSLYNSIKEQTLQTVSECVRRADILEIISRLNGATQGDDESFIKLTLMVQGEKTQTGDYEYPNLLDNLNQTMSDPTRRWRNGTMAALTAFLRTNSISPAYIPRSLQSVR